MYNAYLTSDYTIQVEELDNSYGTAQDWADLHEYEEQEQLNELKVFYTKVRQIYLAGNIPMAAYRVTIDWGLTNVVNALDLIYAKNKQLKSNDFIYLDEEDALRIVRTAKPEHYKFLRVGRAYVFDGNNITPFYLWLAQYHFE